MKSAARLSLVTTLLLLVVGSPLAAQRRSSPSGPSRAGAAARGGPSISLELGEGMGTFLGLWGRVSAPVSLGVEVELDLAQQETGDEDDELQSTTSTVGAGASLKWFLLPRSAIAPFLYGHVGATRETLEREGELPDLETEGTGMLVRGAVGLEWFASRNFSVAGNVGARWRSGEVETEEGGPFGGLGDEEVELLEVFTSGISVAFHF